MAEYQEPPVSHPSVVHRDDFLDVPAGLLRRINTWALEHLTLALGSSFGVWLAFVIPLLAFKIPALLSLLGLVSSYWIQLWALFVLQNSSARSDVKAKAKADADHLAQNHIALTSDETNTIVKAIAQKLEAE